MCVYFYGNLKSRECTKMMTKNKGPASGEVPWYNERAVI